MNIFHYRSHDYSADPWEDGIINDDTKLDDYRTRPIVTLNEQTLIRTHASTYITGRDTSLAHHFVKMVAAAVLKGQYEHAPAMNVTMPDSEPARVLWVDSVRGIHACADFYQEMKNLCCNGHNHFSLMCVDKLGNFRYDFYALLHHIEEAIKQIKPTLLVIDDIDHLMPYCGINVASAFNHVIRDTLNHTDTACLFLGYNHLGKKACTTGNLGKFLFTEATNIFSVTTQQAVSTVKLVRSYCIQSNRESQFLFTVQDDNMPHEVINTRPEQGQDDFMSHNTLQDIFSDVIKPGQTISPDQLCTQLNNRRQQLNRIDRSRALIAQATQLGIIKRTDDSGNYILATATPSDTVSSIQPVNTSLTLPLPPSTPAVPVNEVPLVATQ